MYSLWHLALLATVSLGVEDCILFPFGMGAFIRHLGKNDDRYSSPEVVRGLRRRIADQLMNAIVSIYNDSLKQPETNAKAKAENFKPGLPLRLHLCLVCVSAESVENHNVFIEAAADKLKDYPRLADLLKFRQNVDVLQLAHELASKARQPLKVALLNGANRKLFGNHWFAGGARSAIDENLHRRSASLTRAALLLNMATEPKKRHAEELGQTLKWLGGKVELMNEKSVLASLPTHAAPVDEQPNQKQLQQQQQPKSTADKGATNTASSNPGAGGNGPCVCCKRRPPDQAFSTVVDGYISGGDLHEEKMTVEAAKLKATTLETCQGFCHVGPPTSDAVDIVFKSNYTVEQGGSEKWTTYLRFKQYSAVVKPKAESKAKAKAKAKNAAQNGDQV